EPFGGGRLDANAGRCNAENLRNACDHCRALRADARCLADDRHIDMDDAAARLTHEIGGMTEKEMRGRVAPACIARREMHADVAGAERAQNRIGQGMQPDIGVGMADEALAMRELQPAQPEVIAGPEGMDIETLAGAE